jgi:isoquinoline 1-oxidoreductase subunit beta
MESFVDELAAAAGKDPFEYRLQLLKNPRDRGVLELAAYRAKWGSPLPAGVYRGIAEHFSYGSYCAQVAEVSVARDGRVKVHRIVAAVDAGWVVDPDTFKAQIESGIVYGLSGALFGEITLENGRVAQSNFHDYPVPRISDVPRVEVHILQGEGEQGGAGEPGVPSSTPAVVSAIFAATGKRIRKLPVRPEDLRSA